MATKIRLQRHGRKSYAFYQIVVADSRAPRDGKFIERIGSYNPNTNPATVDLNFERALYWLQVGAQPTDTTRNILSREGVCLKKHLLEGVKKGAFDEATAETKFQAWLKNKQASVQAVKDKDSEAAKAAAIARLEAEKEANKAKAEIVAKKKAELAAAEAAKQLKKQLLPLQQKKLLQQKALNNSSFAKIKKRISLQISSFFSPFISPREHSQKLKTPDPTRESGVPNHNISNRNISKPYFFSKKLSICSTNCSFDKAPWAICGLPVLGMNSNVGILCIPNAEASSFSLSTFIL